MFLLEMMNTSGFDLVRCGFKFTFCTLLGALVLLWLGGSVLALLANKERILEHTPKTIEAYIPCSYFNISLIICVYRMTVEKVELMTKASY